jgi:hypothetical protein
LRNVIGVGGGGWGWGGGVGVGDGTGVGDGDGDGDGVGFRLGVGLGRCVGVGLEGGIDSDAREDDGEGATALAAVGDCEDGGALSAAVVTRMAATPIQPRPATSGFLELTTGTRRRRPPAFVATRTVASDRIPSAPRAGFAGAWTIQARIRR